MQRPIILFGAPRTGSTWLAELLQLADGMHYVHEPDNDGLSFAGLVYKQNNVRFPFISEAPSPNPIGKLFQLAAEGRLPHHRNIYQRALFKLVNLELDQFKQESFGTAEVPSRNLWLARKIFRFGLLQKSNTDRILIKTVHASLASGYILDTIPALQPIFVFRHPANVISSYLYLNLPDADRNLINVPAIHSHFLSDCDLSDIVDDPIARMSLQLAIQYKHLEEVASRYNALCVKHETLCGDPVQEVHAIYNHLDLHWTEKIADQIAAKNQTGSGFETKRLAASMIEVYKERLTLKQIESVKKGWSLLPVNAYSSFRN